MTIQSFTGEINTNREYETIASLSGITFAADTKYTMQVQNSAYIKIGDAEFWVANEKFDYTTGSEDIYIKTTYSSCVLTILENEAE